MANIIIKSDERREQEREVLKEYGVNPDRANASQRELAEKMLANKETDKSLASMIKREIRDDKAVKTAIKRLYNGEFVIREQTAAAAAEADAEVEAVAEAAESAE